MKRNRGKVTEEVQAASQTTSLTTTARATAGITVGRWRDTRPQALSTAILVPPHPALCEAAQQLCTEEAADAAAHRACACRCRGPRKRARAPKGGRRATGGEESQDAPLHLSHPAILFPASQRARATFTMMPLGSAGDTAGGREPWASPAHSQERALGSKGSSRLPSQSWQGRGVGASGRRQRPVGGRTRKAAKAAANQPTCTEDTAPAPWFSWGGLSVTHRSLALPRGPDHLQEGAGGWPAPSGWHIPQNWTRHWTSDLGSFSQGQEGQQLGHRGSVLPGRRPSTCRIGPGTALLTPTTGGHPPTQLPIGASSGLSYRSILPGGPHTQMSLALPPDGRILTRNSRKRPLRTGGL